MSKPNVWVERGNDGNCAGSTHHPAMDSWFANKSDRNRSIRSPSLATFTPERVTSKSSFWRTSTVGYSYRALDKFIAPLVFINIYGVAVTSVNELVTDLSISQTFDSSHLFALTTTLSLMLVFRLSRAAVRWWDSRMMWGLIIAKCRQIGCRIVGFKGTDINIESAESKRRRLEVLMDLVVFAVATRCYLRKVPVVASDLLGVVDKERVDLLNNTDHKVLVAGMDLSKRLVKLHEGKVDNPQLNVALEGKLKLVDDLVQTAGGLERIKNSPLPIIYTAHLRTFLLLYFLFFPFLAMGDLGWYTIPIIAVSSFVFLGVEGAASDVDDGPFDGARVRTQR